MESTITESKKPVIIREHWLRVLDDLTIEYFEKVVRVETAEEM